MPLYRTRRLFLYRGDFRRSAWFREKRPMPGPPAPDGLAFHWLDEAGWRARPQAVVCVPDVAVARFAGGGRCLIATDAAGDTVHEMWVLPTGTWTEWIKAVVEVPDGYCLFAGAWTRPDFRKQSLMRHAATLGCMEACRMGRPGLYAGVEEHEVLRRAERNAKEGRYPMVPDHVLVHRQLLGWNWHWREPPPAKLLRACADAVNRHPEFFTEAGPP